MHKENKVFFSADSEVISKGHRLFGHCMKDAFLSWKTNQKSNSSVNPEKKIEHQS